MCREAWKDVKKVWIKEYILISSNNIIERVMEFDSTTIISYVLNVSRPEDLRKKVIRNVKCEINRINICDNVNVNDPFEFV